jgi:hypothetical protein
MRRLLPVSTLVGMLLSGAAGIAFGHAVLTKATLDTDAVPEHATTTVVLTFNSRIEPAFTKVFLVDSAKRERPLPSRPRQQPSELEVDIPALPAGPYGLRYRVLAADGHVTESLLKFRVRAAQ